MSLMPKASSCWPQTDRIRLGLRLVQAGSAKVRNVGGNQLRLSAGRAGGSGFAYLSAYSTRRFALEFDLDLPQNQHQANKASGVGRSSLTFADRLTLLFPLFGGKDLIVIHRPVHELHELQEPFQSQGFRSFCSFCTA
jgi:hypothetical protein